MSYELTLQNAKNISDVFEMVKKVVREFIGVDQAGLLVGVSDLGGSNQGFIGAFYSLDANMIIINKMPLSRIRDTKPQIYNYYLFHIMLHEYLHSIGSYDEEQTRQMVYEISRNCFGEEHVVTKLATNMSAFIPNLLHPTELPQIQDSNIEFIMGIDKSNTNYIN